MGSERERVESWLSQYLRPRYPELEEPYLKAVNAFDQIRESGHLTAELLRPIVEAASSPRTPLWEPAADYLGWLMHRYQEARDAVVEMSKDRSAQIRFNAVCCLNLTTPIDLQNDVLRRAFQDKAASVRKKAADFSCRCVNRHVVPDLEAAVAQEKNGKTKRSLEWSLRMLRDGYELTSNPDGTFSVSVLRSDGSIRGLSATAAELKERGIESIVAEAMKPRSWEKSSVERKDAW